MPFGKEGGRGLGVGICGLVGWREGADGVGILGAGLV